MIITDDFVMLNFPKTGSSFAREVLRRLYGENTPTRSQKILRRLGLQKPPVMDVLMPLIDDRVHYNVESQHGTLRQIPRAHRGKPVVTITRNPFSRYVSTYFFRWWESHPPADVQTILKKYPNFPDLTFAEYYEMSHLYARQSRLRGIVPKIDLGLHTIQFIQFYFEDPDKVLRTIDDDYIKQGAWKEDLRNITFMHQENLTAELKQFLLDVGFSKSDAAFINDMKKIGVTESAKGSDMTQLINKTIKKQILDRDKLLFKIFPEYLSEGAKK